MMDTEGEEFTSKILGCVHNGPTTHEYLNISKSMFIDSIDQGI